MSNEALKATGFIALVVVTSLILLTALGRVESQKDILRDIRAIESEQRDALWCLYDDLTTGYQPDKCIDRP